MDKYTVDLDKVLNDFEYSELTDNFNSGRAYLAQGASSYASSSKSRSGDAKHSITNVFHSLNEYLNSDISINPKGAHTESNKENVVQNSTALVYSDDAQNRGGVTKNDFEVRTGNLLDLSFTEEISKHDDKTTTNVMSEDNLESNEKCDVCNENSEQGAVKETNPSTLIDEPESEVKESNLEILTDGHNLKEDPNLKSDSKLNIDEIGVQVVPESPHPQENSNLIGDADNLNIAIQTETIESNVPPNLRAEIETEGELKVVVKYDDTIEFDDSTLNRFLDDLEVEFESENLESKNSAESESVSIELACTELEGGKVERDVQGKGETEEFVEKIVEEFIAKIEFEDSIERPTMLPLESASEDEMKKREINLIGEPGSTPYNNLYVSKELNSESVVLKENSVSPTFSEASTDTISDTSDVEIDQRNASTDTDDNIKDTAIQHDDLVAKMRGDQMVQVDECVPSSSNVPQEGETAPENDPVYWLGKQAPLWIPDSEALSCLHCETRFTVIKRRHHCRACGLVLCSKCCNLKYRLDYLDAEARVCLKCYGILNRDSSSSDVSPSTGNSPNRQPNPNNPMEYCSVVPPLQQVGNLSQNPPTVMVPVGVLKRKGSHKKSNKSVMFYDGIRPGSDLTKLDTDFDAPPTKNSNADNRTVKSRGDVPKVYSETHSFVPKNSTELPPLVSVFKSETTYFCNKYKNDVNLLEMLMTEELTFALQKNIFVHVKIIDLSCCINKRVWCFSTEGFLSVGQDEIVYLIEFLENESSLPIDIFNHLNIIYNDALKGTTVSELGISLHDSSTFLDFKNHSGFLYVRPTFQCVQNIIKPSEPYLVGLLIHRWETPWAKIFPLRLLLRLGAEYRYYPSPLISTRYRDSLFVELGHTVITIFADFRNFSYTLPSIRGLTIHMEEKNTTVTLPVNRYDQVMSALNNASDHILPLGGNFSTQADSHLVCIQDTQSSTENAYTTHAINIQNRPRKVTGASFIVFNGALKSTSGLTAKSSIVEDGLMIQITPEDMANLRECLRNMRNYTIQCGCINAPSDETVNIVWGDMDNNFNMGVVSPIDNQSLSGVPSIRVHNGKNYTGPGHSKMIRWTEVFILQNTDEKSKAREPLDVSKISESVAKATCTALVKYLDLLCSNNFFKIGIRTTLHVENVSYSAGSNNVKLPPIYMKSLDNELIPVLHRIVSSNLGDESLTLELVFRILNS